MSGFLAQEVHHLPDIGRWHGTGTSGTDMRCGGRHRRVHIAGEGSKADEPASGVISGQIDHHDCRKIMIPKCLDHGPGIRSLAIPGNYDILYRSDHMNESAQES